MSQRREPGQIVTAIASTVEPTPILGYYDIDKIPGPGDTIAFQQKDIFESVQANASLLKAYLESRLVS